MLIIKCPWNLSIHVAKNLLTEVMSVCDLRGLFERIAYCIVARFSGGNFDKSRYTCGDKSSQCLANLSVEYTQLLTILYAKAWMRKKKYGLVFINDLT